MIAALSGTIVEITEQEIILECPPLFFSVFVPNALTQKLGQKLTLKTYLHWNQEQGFSLFGFQDVSQKLFFLTLLNCSGVGPRLALSILSHAPLLVLCTAIKTSDIKVLTEISGIGQKKAEQIIVHMKHALKTLEPQLALQQTENDNTTMIRDVEQTLLALQYTRTEIYEALKAVQEEQQNAIAESSFDGILRKTLQRLSLQRGIR